MFKGGNFIQTQCISYQMHDYTTPWNMKIMKCHFISSYSAIMKNFAYLFITHYYIPFYSFVQTRQQQKGFAYFLKSVLIPSSNMEFGKDIKVFIKNLHLLKRYGSKWVLGKLSFILEQHLF